MAQQQRKKDSAQPRTQSKNTSGHGKDAVKPRANEITKHLAGISFPVNKKELVAHAKKQGADEDVLQVIRDLPQNNFDAMTDVMKAFGQE